MASSTLVIFAESDGWHVGVRSRSGASGVAVPVPRDATSAARAAALSSALREIGVADDGRTRAVLALSSTACLCAPVGTAGLPARQRGQAMLYRFEEKLPVAAEEVAADFVPAPAGAATALGVAVERRVLDPLVAAVESSGGRVAAVCPASLLALQHWLGNAGQAAGVPDAVDESAMVLWPDGVRGLELFVIAGGAPVAWYVIADDVDDIALHVQMATRAAFRPARLVACGVRPEVVSRIEQLGIPVVQAEPAAIHELATESAPLVVSGKRQPWVDLANGGGAGASRRALGGTWAAVAAAVMVFIGCLAVATLWRAARYERLAAGYETEQQAVFREVLPGQPVPLDVRSRLASEVQRGGASGSSGGIAGLPPSAQGLATLRDVMGFLPGDVRFRVYEVRLRDGGFTLEGETRSHGDAEAIAAALRRRAGFSVDSPRTEQGTGGAVGFTITGGLAPAAGGPRVAHGPLLERPTVVQLRGVTLRQLFTFLHATATGRSRLGLKQIRLSAPAAADTGDKWSVEATLAQLVRAPADDAAVREESR
jgi:hypothetical protein